MAVLLHDRPEAAGQKQREALLQFPGNLVKRSITDAQHIDAVAVQTVTEIPVGLGKMRADKDKIHRVLQLPLSIWGYHTNRFCSALYS